MASGDALPIPRKNVAFRVTFPIFDAAGDLVTGAAGLDSEASQDGGAFSDCTNEATEIGSSGIYYLDLTSAEMNADTVAIIVKTSTSGAKTTPIIMYPEEAGDIRIDGDLIAAAVWDAARASHNDAGSFGEGVSSVQGDITGNLEGAVQGSLIGDVLGDIQGDIVGNIPGIEGAVWSGLLSPGITNIGVISSSSSTLVLDIAAGDAPDDFFNGLLAVAVEEATGLKQARLVTDYVASTQTASISPNWVTNPDNTYIVNFYAFIASSGGLDAAGVRAAVGLASANLDTQLADIETKVDDVETRLGTPSDLGSGATVAANLADIEGQTDDIGVAGAGLTAVPWNAAWGTPVETHADNAMVNRGIDHLMTEAVAGADITDNSIVAKLVSKSATADWDSYNNTTDSLEAQADSATAILEDTGTTLPAQISALNDLSAAEVVTAILEGVIEGTTTLQEAVRLLLAAMVGESSGGGTTEIKFRDLADTKDRITATVDANGNRSAVVRDAS